MLKIQVCTKRFLRYEYIGFPLEHKVTETFCSGVLKNQVVLVLECVFVICIESSLRLLIKCLFGGKGAT